MPEKDRFSEFLSFLSEVWKFLHLSNRPQSTSGSSRPPQCPAPTGLPARHVLRTLPGDAGGARRCAAGILSEDFAAAGSGPCGEESWRQVGHPLGHPKKDQ